MTVLARPCLAIFCGSAMDCLRHLRASTTLPPPLPPLSHPVASHLSSLSVSFSFIANVFFAWNSPHCKLGVGKRLERFSISPFPSSLFFGLILRLDSWTRLADLYNGLSYSIRPSRISDVSYFSPQGRSSSRLIRVLYERTLHEFPCRFNNCLQYLS